MNGDHQMTVIAAAVAFIGFGGFMTLAGFVWKLADRLRSLESEAGLARSAATQAESDVRRVDTELSAFRIEAARRFVTDETIEKLEGRIVDAINRLGDRLDRVIDGRRRGASRSGDDA